MVSRRSFIKQASLGALGFTYIPNLFSRVSPSDRVQVAHIGINGMGSGHLRWFSALKEVDVVGLCDLDSKHLNKAHALFQQLNPSKKAALFDDFRKVLENKEIDAITVATPDHWHATIAAMAFEAGKDVYGEKPLSYDIAEGEMMLRYKQKNKRIFQLGTQIHAGENYHRVAELIQAGVIGEVKEAIIWKNDTSSVIQPTLGLPVPKELNYDMWLGKAPMVDYFPEHVHFNYRYFKDYSSGVFADFWCHIADVVFMALAPKNIKTISAKGADTPGIADAPWWLDADFEFDNLNLKWRTMPPKYKGANRLSIGALFKGEKGNILCDYGTKRIDIGSESFEDIASVPKTLPRSPGHQQNFIDSVKSRLEPESNLEYAEQMTLPMHLALIAYRLGRPVIWDSQNGDFIGDSEASQMKSRVGRKQWELI